MRTEASRFIALLGTLAIVLGTAGCSLTEKREIRTAALEALRAEGALPAGATLPSPSAASVFNAKNAATVEIPVTVQEAGGPVVRVYAVWVKRLGTRWVADGFAAMPVGVSQGAAAPLP